MRPRSVSLATPLLVVFLKYSLTKCFYSVSVSELHLAAEAARLAERGQSQPPLDEQECIRLRIRRLQSRLSALQAEM